METEMNALTKLLRELEQRPDRFTHSERKRILDDAIHALSRLGLHEDPAAWLTSGKYEDLADPPTIPAAQVNSDWNATSGPEEILNKPSQLAALPTLTIEFGHSAQANGGRGVDMGSWYQLDFRIGTSGSGGFQYTVNEDGTITLGQGGVYLVSAGLTVGAQNDTYGVPLLMTVATGMNYAWPGLYQYAVQAKPNQFAMAGQAQLSGEPGYIPMCGVARLWGTSSPLWLGFSKIAGVNGNILSLKGFLTYVKVG
jgi:hypothetical protein